MYQAGPPPAIDGTGSTQVILILDVPAGFIELPLRTAQLADEFGQVISRSIPGVRARSAVIAPVGADVPGRAPIGRRFDGLLIDRAAREVRNFGVPVRLSYREFELLCFLAEHPRRPVSRAQLIREVWAGGSAACDGAPSGRTVDTHVHRLRTKLGSQAGIITTVRGRGYRFDAGTDVRYLPATRTQTPVTA